MSLPERHAVLFCAFKSELVAGVVCHGMSEAVTAGIDDLAVSGINVVIDVHRHLDVEPIYPH